MDLGRVFIVALKRYAELGADVGAWFTLPVDIEEVEERLNIEYGNDELAIHDIDDTRIPLGEYENLEDLNSACEELLNLSEDYITVMYQVMKDCGLALDDYIEKVKDGDIIIWFGCDDMADVVSRLEEVCGDFDIDTYKRYFSYESYGRDLEISGQYSDTSLGIVEVV